MSASYSIVCKEDNTIEILETRKDETVLKVFPAGTKLSFNIPMEDRSVDLDSVPEYKADKPTLIWYVDKKL